MCPTRHSHLTLKVSLVLCVGLLMVVPTMAQRSGSAAGGGRVTPERVETEKVTGVTIAAVPEDECDPCPGDYSFTYGFNANDRPRHGGAKTLKAGFAFSVYIVPRVFLEIDNDNVVSIKDPSGDRVTGLGDTSVYLGLDALSEGKRRPAITLLYGVKAPTASASKGLGSGEVDHTLLAAIGKTFSQGRTYLEFDVGDYIAGEANSRDFNHFPFAAAFLKRKLDDDGKYRLHLEVGGNFATSISNAEMYNLNYLETRLSKSDAKHYVGLRTGVRVGLTPNVSRVGLYVGIKFAGSLKGN